MTQGGQLPRHRSKLPLQSCMKVGGAAPASLARSLGHKVYQEQARSPENSCHAVRGHSSGVTCKLISALQLVHHDQPPTGQILQHSNSGSEDMVSSTVSMEFLLHQGCFSVLASCACPEGYLGQIHKTLYYSCRIVHNTPESAKHPNGRLTLQNSLQIAGLWTRGQDWQAQSA